MYLKTLTNGSIEANSLATVRNHFDRLTETLGGRFKMQGFALQDLQRHIERRRKSGIAPTTVRKELSTLRACWQWAVHGQLLAESFPNQGLKYPKEDEKEPFRTFAETQAVIAAEQPDEAQADVLWESLYLNRPEIEEFLTHIEQHAT